MKSSVSIRRATEADLPTLVRLNAMVQELHAGNEPTAFKRPSLDPTSRAMFQKHLTELGTCILAAEADQGVAGHLFAQETKKDADWLRPAQRYWMPEHIAVDPAFRRQGIAHALMAGYFDEAKTRGISRAELVYWDFNEAAGRFFHELGFVPMHLRMAKTSL